MVHRTPFYASHLSILLSSPRFTHCLLACLLSHGAHFVCLGFVWKILSDIVCREFQQPSSFKKPESKGHFKDHIASIWQGNKVDRKALREKKVKTKVGGKGLVSKAKLHSYLLHSSLFNEHIRTRKCAENNSASQRTSEPAGSLLSQSSVLHAVFVCTPGA